MVERRKRNTAKKLGEHLTDELIGDENEIIRGAGTLPRPTNSSYSSNDAYWGRDNKYRMLVEQANDGITIIQDGIIVYVNPMMAQMHGGTVESIIGSRMVDHFHISEIDRIIDINKRRMAGENDVPYSYEAITIKSDGSTANAEINVGVVDFKGRPAALAIIRDITQRKKLEKELMESRDELESRVRERTAELHESHERFRDLVDLLPQIVFEADKNGCLTYINRLGLETFGFSAEDFSRGVHITEIIAPSDRDRALANFKRRLDGETVGECYEYSVRKKDMTEFPVFIRITSIVDGTGIKGIRGIVVDLTESRRIETERARLEDELRHAQKMEALGTMAGGVAHDFNNILAAIIGFTEMALEKFPEDNPQKRHLERVLKSGLRGRDIVKQMLAFSRKNELALEPVNLNSVLEETVNLLRASIPSTIDIKIDTENVPMIIFADFTHLQQIIFNLCNNASDAMSDTGGILTIEVSPYHVKRDNDISNLSAGPYVRISVIDDGKGIPAGILDRVFEPFFTTKQIGRGTGLGLAAVHGIVTSFGGAITVQSEIGRGTRFDVYLRREANENPGIESLAPAISGGKEHVLFVDDEDILVDLAKAMIESMGYRVTAKTSSREILEIYRENPHQFDIVISDQTMPDMTGYQLSKEIKSIKNIPFILSTGFSYAVDRESAIKAGIDAFVMKPLTKSELARTIRDVLDARD